MIRLVLLVFLIFLFGRCTKVQDPIGYDDFEPILVMNGTVSAHSGIIIYLSQLTNPSTTISVREIAVSNALIFVVDEKDTFFLEEVESGIYKSDSTLNIDMGKTYRVYSEFVGYPSVYSDVSVPSNQIANLAASISRSNFSDEPYSQNAIEVLVTWDDLLDRKAFYSLLVEGGSTFRDYILFRQSGTADLDVSDFFCNAISTVSGIAFDNSCHHQSRAKSVNLILSDVDSEGVVNVDPEFRLVENRSVTIVLSAVDQFFFEYAQYIDRLPTNIDLIFTELGDTPSNVHGGFGAVFGLAEETVTIVF